MKANRPRLSRIFFVVLVLILLSVTYRFRDSIRKLPRVRVGSLHKDIAGQGPLKFFVIGDSGTGGPSQLAVASAMEQRCEKTGGFSGILMLGDNVYPAGVTSTDDRLWQERIFEPYGSPCLEKLPLYAVLGNHDYKGNPSAEIEMTLVNKRWYLPNRFYSVRFGSLLNLIAFDSELSEFCFRDHFCTYDYLLSAARSYPATWTIVMSHHPLISASTKSGGHEGGYRKYFIRPFMCDLIDAWLAGHAHHLEHRKDGACRAEYFISGAAGADLYPVVPNSGVEFAESEHGFLELSLTKDRMLSEFFNERGELLDSSVKEPYQPR